MASVIVIQYHRGRDVEREYIQREAKRKARRMCRGCHGDIKIGQLYWAYYSDIYYHDLCFRESNAEAQAVRAVEL